MQGPGHDLPTQSGGWGAPPSAGGGAQDLVGQGWGSGNYWAKLKKDDPGPHGSKAPTAAGLSQGWGPGPPLWEMVPLQSQEAGPQVPQCESGSPQPLGRVGVRGPGPPKGCRALAIPEMSWWAGSRVTQVGGGALLPPEPKQSQEVGPQAPLVGIGAQAAARLT